MSWFLVVGDSGQELLDFCHHFGHGSAAGFDRGSQRRLDTQRAAPMSDGMASHEGRVIVDFDTDVPSFTTYLLNLSCINPYVNRGGAR